MAHHDTLTDLPNRALFADRLQTAIALAKRSGLVALHCLNIDKFKPINDTLGHDAGDALLIATAERLRKAVRENDTVARLSGDEFAIVQTGIREPADASVLARRVLSVFSSPFEILGTTVDRAHLHRHCLRPEGRRHDGRGAEEGRRGSLPQQVQRRRPLLLLQRPGKRSEALSRTNQRNVG